MIEENTPRIVTQRLILRKFEERDLEDMFAIYSNEKVNEFLPWFPHKSLEDTRKYLHNNIFVDYKKSSAYRYAVELKQTGKVVGYISIGSLNTQEKCGDLGYGLHQEFWGRGIVPEASVAVLQKLRENGFSYVTATHDMNNKKSGRVMQKIGMKYIRDYDEMWQPKNFRVTFRLYRLDF